MIKETLEPVNHKKTFNNKIKNKEGKKIGRIKNLVIDLTYGNIAYAVLQLEKETSSGYQNLAVPWDALVLGNDGSHFVLDVDKNN